MLAVHFQLSENGETTELVKGIMDKIDAISTAGTVTEVGPLVFTPVVDALKAQNLHQYTGKFIPVTTRLLCTPNTLQDLSLPLLALRVSPSLLLPYNFL